MKSLLVAAFALASMHSYAFVITSVKSAEFSQKNTITDGQYIVGKSLLKIEYHSGGCDPKGNKPVIKLEHISTTDVTPQWAVDENPNIIREYQVRMQAKVVETGNGGPCMMAYDLKVEGDLNEMFKEVAPSLGIDLGAKKAHYSVNITAPPVTGGVSFSAFE